MLSVNFQTLELYKEIVPNFLTVFNYRTVLNYFYYDYFSSTRLFQLIINTITKTLLFEYNYEKLWMCC